MKTSYRRLTDTRWIAALATIPVLMAASAFHLELMESYPDEDQVLEESPSEIWLRFSGPPNLEETSFSVRGATGRVQLSDIVAGEEAEVIRASVAEPLEDGEYALSWVAAPEGDHAVRGRYSFTVETGR